MGPEGHERPANRQLLGTHPDSDRLGLVRFRHKRDGEGNARALDARGRSEHDLQHGMSGEQG
jgi:hypothetical protein